LGITCAIANCPNAENCPEKNDQCESLIALRMSEDEIDRYLNCASEFAKSLLYNSEAKNKRVSDIQELSDLNDKI
jgi:hypothetical protein